MGIDETVQDQPPLSRLLNIDKTVEEQVELTRFLLRLGYTRTPFLPREGVSLSASTGMSVTTHALLTEIVRLEMLHTAGKPEEVWRRYPSYPPGAYAAPCARIVLGRSYDCLAPTILRRLALPPLQRAEDLTHFVGLVGGTHPHGALYVSGLVPAAYSIGAAVAYSDEGPHPHLGPFIQDFGKVMRATEDEQGRPESDSTHTVILALAALDLAKQIVAAGGSAAVAFNPQRVFDLALVHDLVETYAGDVNTLQALSSEAQKAKKERELEALNRILMEMADCVWLVHALLEYDLQRSVEARFVRILDKATPNWTHELNGCAVPRRKGMTPEELAGEHRRQVDLLAHLAGAHPALQVALDVLRASGHRAVEAYGFRAAEVPAYRRDADGG